MLQAMLQMITNGRLARSAVRLGTDHANANQNDLIRM
jgi:hypothetical protein